MFLLYKKTPKCMDTMIREIAIKPSIIFNLLFFIFSFDWSSFFFHLNFYDFALIYFITIPFEKMKSSTIDNTKKTFVEKRSLDIRFFLFFFYLKFYLKIKIFRKINFMLLSNLEIQIFWNIRYKKKLYIVSVNT